MTPAPHPRDAADATEAGPVRDDPPLRRPTANARRGNRLSILMVTPEAHPFAKTGGLAEVTGRSPTRSRGLGHA